MDLLEGASVLTPPVFSTCVLDVHVPTPSSPNVSDHPLPPPCNDCLPVGPQQLMSFQLLLSPMASP